MEPCYNDMSMYILKQPDYIAGYFSEINDEMLHEWKNKSSIYLEAAERYKASLEDRDKTECVYKNVEKMCYFIEKYIAELPQITNFLVIILLQLIWTLFHRYPLIWEDRLVIFKVVFCFCIFIFIAALQQFMDGYEISQALRKTSIF